MSTKNLFIRGMPSEVASRLRVRCSLNEETYAQYITRLVNKDTEHGRKKKRTGNTRKSKKSTK